MAGQGDLEMKIFFTTFLSILPLAGPAQATALPQQTNSVGMTMVKVPGAEFLMGDQSCKMVAKMCEDPFDRTKEAAPCADGSKVEQCLGHKREQPVHKVKVSSFWIATTEVTQRQYFEVTGKNPAYFTSDRLDNRSENNPVETITWYEAVEFANTLSVKEGLPVCYQKKKSKITLKPGCSGYRLPTEAEWEYAARANQKTVFAGSDNADEVAWMKSNSAKEKQPKRSLSWHVGAREPDRSTRPVAQKKPNAWGIYDMSGNVTEWIWDTYWIYPGSSEKRNPSHNALRGQRGGSFMSKPELVRIAARTAHMRNVKYKFLGMRLVRSAK